MKNTAFMREMSPLGACIKGGGIKIFMLQILRVDVAARGDSIVHHLSEMCERLCVYIYILGAKAVYKNTRNVIFHT